MPVHPEEYAQTRRLFLRTVIDEWKSDSMATADAAVLLTEFITNEATHRLDGNEHVLLAHCLKIIFEHLGTQKMDANEAVRTLMQIISASAVDRQATFAVLHRC